MHLPRKILLLLALCLASWAMAAPAATRVAILADGTDPVADLAVAELSSEPGVELLERSQVNGLLREQKLSASLLDEQRILVLGKLLAVDLFAVVESDFRTKAPIGVVVYAADTGVRYQDTSLLAVSPDLQAKAVADAVRAAVAKHHAVGQDKLRYFSLVAVRNAGLPRAKEPLCQAVGMLLMRQLGASPDIAILERRHLEYLNQERHLPTGMAAPRNLIAATGMLEVGPGADGRGLAATLFLDHQPTATATDPSDPARLAAALAADFLTKAHLASAQFATAFDYSREASRLLSEYHFLKQRGRTLEAHEKIQACHALQPDVPSGDLIFSCWQAAMARGQDQPEKALDDIEFGMALFARWYDPAKPLQHQLDQATLFSIARRAETDNAFAAVRDRANELLSAWHQVRLRQLADQHKAGPGMAVATFPQFEHYTEFMRAYVLPLQHAPASFRINHLLPSLRDWLATGIDLARQRFPNEAPLFPRDGYTIVQSVLVEPLGPQAIAELSPRELAITREILQLMAKSQVPTLAVLGFGAQLRLEGLIRQADDPKWQKGIQRLVAFAQAQIEALGDHPRYDLERGMCYHLAGESINTNWLKSPAGKLYCRGFYEFMIARREIELGVVRDSTYLSEIGIAKHDPDDIRAIATRAQRILAMLDQPDTRILFQATYDSPSLYRDEIRRAVVATMAAIERHHPDLIPEAGPPVRIVGKIPTASSRINPILTDDHLLVLNADGRRRRLLRLPLASGSPATVAEFNVATPLGHRGWGGDPTCLHRDLLYHATTDAGLAIIPRHDNPEVKWLDMSKGLASNYIQSFAILGDQLYLATGNTDATSRPEEFNLYRHDLKRGSLAHLASSGAKARTSPFDNLAKPPLAIGMMADPERSRIILAIGGLHASRELRGLWEFPQPATGGEPPGEWRKIPDTDHDAWTLFHRRGGRWLLSGFDATYQFSPETDRLSLVFNWRQQESRFPVLFPPLNGHATRSNGHVLLAGSHFWCGTPNGPAHRIALADGQTETLSWPAPAWFLDATPDGKRLILGAGNEIIVYEVREP
jgi:hypothetical protein